MKKLKVVIACSVFGFFFSLLIGCISPGVGIGWAFLRAFCIALVFGGIGFGLSFLLGNLMDVDSSDDISVAGVTGTTSTGQNVNLVTPDDPIPVDNEASQFFVGDQHQMLAKDDYKKESEGDDVNTSSESENVFQAPPSGEPVSHQESSSAAAELIARQNAQAIKSEQPGVSSPSVSGNVYRGGNGQSVVDEFNISSQKLKTSEDKKEDSSGFVPIALAENVSNISSVEAASKNDYIKENNIEKSSESSNSEELDALPDIQELEDITVETGGTVESSSPGIDGVGSETFESGPVSSKKSENPVEGQDTAIIAKAISTLLAKQ